MYSRQAMPWVIFRQDWMERTIGFQCLQWICYPFVGWSRLFYYKTQEKSRYQHADLYYHWKNFFQHVLELLRANIGLLLTSAVTLKCDGPIDIIATRSKPSVSLSFFPIFPVDLLVLHFPFGWSWICQSNQPSQVERLIGRGSFGYVVCACGGT